MKEEAVKETHFGTPLQYNIHTKGLNVNDKTFLGLYKIVKKPFY